jgi:hypothetical protein
VGIAMGALAEDEAVNPVFRQFDAGSKSGASSANDENVGMKRFGCAHGSILLRRGSMIRRADSCRSRRHGLPFTDS